MLIFNELIARKRIKGMALDTKLYEMLTVKSKPRLKQLACIMIKRSKRFET